MNPHKITKEQFALWTEEYQTFIRQMRFQPPLDRERSILYFMERVLLRVRLSIGLGDPGTPTHDLDEIGEAVEDENPDGFREAD